MKILYPEVHTLFDLFRFCEIWQGVSATASDHFHIRCLQDICLHAVCLPVRPFMMSGAASCMVIPLHGDMSLNRQWLLLHKLVFVPSK